MLIMPTTLMEPPLVSTIWPTGLQRNTIYSKDSERRERSARLTAMSSLMTQSLTKKKREREEIQEEVENLPRKEEKEEDSKSSRVKMSNPRDHQPRKMVKKDTIDILENIEDHQRMRKVQRKMEREDIMDITQEDHHPRMEREDNMDTTQEDHLQKMERDQKDTQRMVRDQRDHPKISKRKLQSSQNL